MCPVCITSMKAYICLVILLQAHVLFGANTECKDPIDGEHDCPETEYDTYMTCLRSRMKRSTCIDSCQGASCGCNQCNCNSCTENRCSSNCNLCCANFQQPCTNQQCCYKNCHSECASTDCRKTCRRSCTEKITTAQNNTSGHLHNITTVISIRNIINNTNIIDMPVHVNNTNINNITIALSNNTATSDGSKCCHIVSPRHCFPTTKYPFVRCAHYRKQVCNNICTAPIMHAQPHQVCDEVPIGPPTCRQQIIYIPQPQPRCVYQSAWPYVSCGLQNPACSGCYSHYTSGGQPPSECSPACYNEGYGVGPYYRQGPYYRPGFAHVPSCLQTGTCDPGNVPPYTDPGFLPNGGGMGLPVGGGMGLPLSGAGYPPASYDNYYSVEVDPSAGLFFNTSEFKIEDHQPQLDEVPKIVQIETTKYHPQTTDSDASVTITGVDEGGLVPVAE